MNQRIGWGVVFIALGVAATLLMKAGAYGLMLFVMMPALLGGIAERLFRPATSLRAAGYGVIAAVASSLGLLALGLEGVICVAMDLPLSVPLGAFGGWLTFHTFRSPRHRSAGVAMILLLQPATLTWDLTAPSPLFEVHSAIEISAPPEKVWKNVVSFSDLPEPQEWYFHTGLAYPLRARIEGTGPGAIRYCEFSTGPFVEPIQVWDEPRLLQFTVTSNPEPMHELSPYGTITPKHLRGYMVSKKGQFRLIPLPGGRTRLEGTTWYRHGLWPSQYWRWWSDAIIHRIHLRVLNHIRVLSEG